jgi:hypothetical protein|tara:strand:- start:329 stop:622 length:294 start_codon:yes stop_codon:yes gene_type:complete
MLLNKHIDNESIENLYESSNILASRYNTISQKLAIIFKGGRQYLYHDVKRTDYNEFENAISQGKILNSKIKKYKSDKIDDIVDTTPILEQIEILKNQ